MAATIAILRARLKQDTEDGPTNLIRASRTGESMKELVSSAEAVSESRQAVGRVTEVVRSSVEPLAPEHVLELHRQSHWYTLEHAGEALRRG